MPAIVEKIALPRPKQRDAIAIATIFAPSRMINPVSPDAIPISTISLMSMGMNNSKTASAPLHKTPSIINFTYPFVWAASVFNTRIPPPVPVFILIRTGQI